MDHAVLEELRATADEHTAPKLRLYLEGEGVHDSWEDAYPGFKTCVEVIEHGAARPLP